MAMEMRQQLKMSQQLVMTPQLQQAIKLLQLTRLELQDVVRQELEENPLLEESLEADEIRETEQTEQAELIEREDAPEAPVEDFKEVEAGDETLRDWDSYLDGYTYSSGEQYREDDERPSFENQMTRRGTLTDHLLWQLHMGPFSGEEVIIGEEIIGNIDDDGYLRASLEEIAAACSIDTGLVTPVLERIQEFDPCGIAARSVQECLLIQARFLGMQGSVVERILQHNLKDLETRKYKQIARDLSVDINEVLMSAKIIGGFDPKPGSMYSSEDVHYISADIFIYKVGDEYLVMLNEEGLPNLKVSPYYAEAKTNGLVDSRADEYINEKVRSALWLIKSIQQRQRTIYKVAKSIIKLQRDFLDRGIEHLRPLVLRDVADDIGMHESTISRVTTNKYMQTPQGLFELKYFFNSGLSTSEGDFVASESVKNRIREIIEKEDPKKPLSDQKIAGMLSGETVNIARRTVTKYREVLKLGSSSERKRHF
ncbi:MAG: RNA polymerase factor sigma-54 [Desulfuromonadales bacterium]|nr:RNA polymerase factor sigma-54 [Desulfuromonadales bacterium]